ncbi:MAG: SMC-Scp complex subunit ScpB [Monoglobales bacterium]
MTEIKYAIEGILFAAGEPVKEAKLAVVLDTDINTVRNAVADLKAEYDLKKRGFNIIDINDGYQICSRPEYYVYIQEILGEQRNQPLSNAAMEALAIIAYKQPITKGMIEKIRGVNSDSCVNRLYERGLIDECGRLEAPGRPVLYKTTDTFLRCFGLSSPKELPDIDLKKLGIEPQSESNNNDEIIQKKNGNNENKENTENFIGNKEEKEE